MLWVPDAAWLRISQYLVETLPMPILRTPRTVSFASLVIPVVGHLRPKGYANSAIWVLIVTGLHVLQLRRHRYFDFGPRGRGYTPRHASKASLRTDWLPRDLASNRLICQQSCRAAMKQASVDGRGDPARW
jgi:hypothetical protein